MGCGVSPRASAEKQSRKSKWLLTGASEPGRGASPAKVSAAKRLLSEMAKEHADAALKTLANIASDGESEAARVTAAVAILDRAFGKPVQSHELTGKDGKDLPAPTAPVTIFQLPDNGRG